MYPLELRASNDSRSELTDLTNQNPLVEFGKTVNISNNTEDSVYGQVRSSENNIYVVWQESVPGRAVGNYEIFFKKSNNSGNSFEREIRLSNNSGFSEHPQMSSENGNIYVVWADNTNVNKQIYFRKSIDGGNSFDEQMLLSNSNSNAFNQEIASFGKNVHIVWLEKIPNGPYRTMTTSSTDGGETFHKPIVLSENASAQTFPKISTYDNHVYVTWNVEDEPDTDNGIYFTSSSDNGMTFGNISRLNTEEKDYGEPQVTSARNQVYVIWGGSDTHRLSSLNIIKSDDYGNTFSEIKKLSETDLGKLNEPSNAEIAIDQNDRLFIAWQDKVNASGKDEILFAFSTDRGKTFSNVTNVSNNLDISECPSIIATEDTVFVTWEDLTPGNHEILFSRGMIV
ncbi:MAG TPA: sialidase family protein [Nitrososphaeraceae archaeon]|nr:sialidase family protein [Nitrososphaeraceae archaeon]